MKRLHELFVRVLLMFVFAGLLAQHNPLGQDTDAHRAEERLIFQTGQPWTPRTNLNADVVMVYGIGAETASTLLSWRRHGYVTDVMTGVAWGSYQDYLNGRFDGQIHDDQAQMDANGDPILHGGNKAIPYISPGESYGRYLSQGIKHALDEGAESIYLEEPEFWASSGWEENFKHEWKAYYGEDWQPPNSSPNAQYRASKLKYFLYRRSLAEIFDFVREYGRANGRVIHIYVATHSLINYANWRIVSPESSLIAAGADGYVAQVWTGTARTPNYCNGIRKERTFETAFLEYGSTQNLARATGLPIWYLNDPIEDDPNHDWNDYRSNWESTLTASLLQPGVWRYEIMPWPERVFNSKHPVNPPATIKNSVEQLKEARLGSKPGGYGPEPSIEKVGIPEAYETELQSVINALEDMKQKDVRWQVAGTDSIGVLVSDTMMFERADPFPSDSSLGSFYGLALPLVEHGLPIEPVQIETAISPTALKRYKLLLLTYEGQKPPSPQFHDTLAEWVRRGGALVVIDNDDDRYNAVREWWNTTPDSYKTPREHLFDKLGIARDAVGFHRVGRGVVLSERVSPASLSHRKEGGKIIRGYTRQAATAINLAWKETNALVLRRGPYIIASSLDESRRRGEPYILHGRFVNLFDANLSVLTNATLFPNSRMLLVDLDIATRSDGPKVIAASCRITNERIDPDNLTFQADGIADTNAVVRIATPKRPIRILVGGVSLDTKDYEMSKGTLLIRFRNSAAPVRIEMTFAK